MFLDNNLNFFFSKKLNELLKIKNNTIDKCISSQKHRTNINLDNFNKKFSNKYYFKDFYFIRGSLFFTLKDQFDFILNFIKTSKNYMTFFNNNMYDNNLVVYDNSPCHYLERLFGY